MERKLAEIKTSKKKILLYVAMRLPILALGILASVAAVNEASNPNYIAMVVILILLIAYICLPLRHWGDMLTYYDNKITLNKKEISFDNSSQLQWVRRSRYTIGARLVIYKQSGKTGLKEIFFPSDEIDVTYMDMPKEHFVRCYLNQVNTVKII